ncbi:hypothetical protein MKW92_016990 [Papaver armeniacum]|nr:hypothetical protein MKW92_016990 [Papaver armeniacum]
MKQKPYLFTPPHIFTSLSPSYLSPLFLLLFVIYSIFLIDSSINGELHIGFVNGIQFSPHMAAKMRPPITHVIRGRPSNKRAIHIYERPRWMFVAVFAFLSYFVWFTSCSLLTVSWALLIGILSPLLHASFQTPNLKARLNTFREDFRAVWRN